MAISLAIYVVLLFVFVWIPAQLLKYWLGPSPFMLRTFYLAPEIQIPIELVLFHLAMLAFLERCKVRTSQYMQMSVREKPNVNILKSRMQGYIGRIQHAWLVMLCGKLGLVKYLLPVAGETTGDPGSQGRHGEPLRRPPLGGDDFLGVEQVRSPTCRSWV